MAFKAGFALALVLGIQVMLFLGQTAVTNINPSAQQFYDSSGTLLASADSGNFTLTDQDPTLPSGSGEVDPTTGNFFTDIFGAIREWFTSTTLGKNIVGVTKAVPNFLNALNLPSEFVFAISSFWYILTGFLLVLILAGRSE